MKKYSLYDNFLKRFFSVTLSIYYPARAVIHHRSSIDRTVILLQEKRVMLTRRAIGNLINRYNAVLKKCRLLNVFGSLAAAALLVGGVCSVSFADEERGSITTSTSIFTDTTVTANRTMNNAVVGIYGGSSQSLSLDIANVTLTVKNSADSNVSRFYGVAATTGSLVTFYQDTGAANAKLNIELEAADGQDAILFSTTGAKLTVYPIVNATVKGGSSGNVIGVEAASGSKIDFDGTETLLNVISNGGNAFGVYNDQTSSSSEIGFSSPNTTIKVQNSTDSTGVTKGVMAYQSQTSFTGNNTNISVQGAEAIPSVFTL